MAKSPDQDLSRRERQIMNVLYRLGKASVSDVAAGIPDPPSDTAIRTFLRILEEKGQVRREREGRRHLYRPAMSRSRAARAALSSVLSTFFDGSLGNAVAAHLSDPSSDVDTDELKRLRRMIADAKKESE